MGLIAKLFYQGEYATVLERTYDDQKVIEPSLIPFILGSLGFLGRTEECEAFFKSHQKQLTSEQESYGYFFLAIAWTRRSQYKKARIYLQHNKNLKNQSGKSNEEINFLVAQGISFFLYYLGQFDRSLIWCQKSLRASMTLDNFWMKALALDLLGNNLIQNGHVFEGLQHLQQAIKVSKKMGNNSLAEMIETSLLIYQNEYGVQITTSFQQLEKKCKKLTSKDSFSKANLGLELARQLTLRGSFNEATRVLKEISELIYQSQNRRQEVRFNLRWAELCYLRHELATGLHYIRSGKKSLNYVDQTYEIQLLGLEIKILEKEGSAVNLPALKNHLLTLSKKFKSVKNGNILARDYDITQLEFENTDDEIHRLILKASQSPLQARKIILETGFFSWLYRFFSLKTNEHYIVLNFEPKSITCVDSHSIAHKPSELSSLNYKIITTLAEGFKTKQELLELIWGYQYDPLRHDSLIYSAFSNLRKILGQHAWFLETTEMGYHLKATVLDHQLKAVVSKDQSVKITEPVLNHDLESYVKLGINSRQIQILQYLEKNPFIAVKKAQEIFTTSEITANRDLRSLFQRKLVVRVGLGRATQYALNTKRS